MPTLVRCAAGERVAIAKYDFATAQAGAILLHHDDVVEADRGFIKFLKLQATTPCYDELQLRECLAILDDPDKLTLQAMVIGVSLRADMGQGW